MSYTCPRCGKTSHSPDDELHGYCGNCHDFTWETGRLHVRTETGSEYVLDRESRTWTRVAWTDMGGEVRTGGTGRYWSFAVNDPGLVIIGPSVDPDMFFRAIRTSPITETWEEPVTGEVEKLNKKLKDKHAFRVREGQEGAGEDPPQDQGG